MFKFILPFTLLLSFNANAMDYNHAVDECLTEQFIVGKVAFFRLREYPPQNSYNMAKDLLVQADKWTDKRSDKYLKAIVNHVYKMPYMSLDIVNAIYSQDYMDSCVNVRMATQYAELK